jgi:hypothetical protein
VAISDDDAALFQFDTAANLFISVPLIVSSVPFEWTRFQNGQPVEPAPSVQLTLTLTMRRQMQPPKGAVNRAH